MGTRMDAMRSLHQTRRTAGDPRTRHGSRPGLRAALTVLLALAAAGARPAEVSGPPSVLPFIDDDYARALSEARARDLPLFIEAWAPW
jgi:hypothetical protein